MGTTATHRRPLLLAALTTVSLAGAVSLDLLRPTPALAQDRGCSNTVCVLTSSCTFRMGYRCWFADRRTCTTQQCPFLVIQ